MKPLLAATIEDIHKLSYPLYASPKIDGIRCLLLESRFNAGVRMVYSRSLKPIPNIHIRSTLTRSNLPLGLDGELIVGTNFQQTTSAVMSAGGEPHFCYLVFDYIGGGTQLPYAERLTQLEVICKTYGYNWLQMLEQKLITSPEQLQAYEDDALLQGFEGVMLRSPAGLYKSGRSTLKQQYLLKLKRFTDAEAIVVDFEELLHNCNEQTTSALGLAERATDQHNLVPGNTLGSLVVQDCKTGIAFRIGTGFTERQRKEIWQKRAEYIGKVLTYKYQNYGIKNAPRAPVFMRWRPDYKL